MTKFLTKAALAATALTAFATPAMAAPAATGSFSANATIVKPVTMTRTANLSFGTVTMNPTLTSATVNVANATGSTAVCSSAMLTCSGGAPAAFNLTAGVYNQTVRVTFTAPTELRIGTTASTVPFSLNNASLDVPLDATGIGSFSVGGQITVANTTTDGDYTGTVNVVANYL